MIQIEGNMTMLKERLVQAESTISRYSEANIHLTLLNTFQARELTHLNKACARKERRLKELRAVEQLYKEYVKRQTTIREVV